MDVVGYFGDIERYAAVGAEMAGWTGMGRGVFACDGSGRWVLGTGTWCLRRVALLIAVVWVWLLRFLLRLRRSGRSEWSC